MACCLLVARTGQWQITHLRGQMGPDEVGGPQGVGRQHQEQEQCGDGNGTCETQWNDAPPLEDYGTIQSDSQTGESIDSINPQRGFYQNRAQLGGKHGVIHFGLV